MSKKKPLFSYKFNDFNLTLSPLNLYKNNDLVSTTPKSLELLLFLIKNQNQPVTKQQIFDQVWQDVFVTDSVLLVNINTLRKIVGSDIISNVRGVGYVFNGNAQIISADEVSESENFSKDLDLKFDSFVGREREINFLRINRQAIMSNQGMSVLVVGEAGIGKTTLIREFLNELSESNNNLVLTTSFFDFADYGNESVSVYFDLLSQAFTKLNFNVSNSYNLEKNVAEIAKEKLNVHIPTDLIDEIYNNSADSGKLNYLCTKIIECFAALSNQTKTIIYFDDIQWASKFSLNMVGQILRVSKKTSLTVIISARTDEETKKIEHFTNWLETHTKQNSFTKIELKPFELTDCENLFTETFCSINKIRGFTENDLSEIHKITHGNPYFLKELIYWLIADKKICKLIESKDFSYEWKGMKNVEIPSSLMSFALSRIDSLSENDRKLLEIACIAGEEFQLKTVAEVSDLPISEITNSFENAVEKEILTKQIFNRGNDYRFRHNLLHRTLYETILPATLFALHEKTAQILEKNHSENLAPLADLLANHYQAAQNYQKCLEWSIEAAKFAGKTEDWVKIGKMISQSENCIVKLKENLEFSLENQYYFNFFKAYYLLHLQRDNENIPTLFEKSIEIAKKLESKEKLADSYYSYSKFFRIKGETEKFREYFEEAEKIAKDTNYNKIYWLAKKESVIYEMLKGDYKNALKKAKELLPNITDEYAESKLSALFGEILSFIGNYEEAKTHIVKALNLFQKLGMDNEYNGAYLNDFVKYHLLTGKYQKGINILDNINEYLKLNNFDTFILYTKLNKVSIRIAQGLLSEAKEISEEVLAGINKDNTFYLNYLMLKNLANIYLAEKNLNQAQKYIIGYTEKISKVDDYDLNAESELLFARFYNAKRNFNESNKHSQKALGFAIKAGSQLNEALALLELATSIQTYSPTESINQTKKSIEILERINSGEQWRGYWTLAKIQSSISTKLVSEKEIIETLEKTVALLDAIRNQFDLSVYEEISRYEESTKTFSEVAKKLASIYEKNGDLQKSKNLNSSWKII